MAKTNPIGIRFDIDLLEKVKTAGLADSPQKAHNLYEKSFVELLELKVEINNKPENKEKIQAERKNATERSKPVMVQLNQDSFTKHPLWKEGDPKEGSGGFYMKYGFSTYDEIEKSKTK